MGWGSLTGRKRLRGGRGDGTLLGRVLLLCNRGNRQGKSGHSLPGSALGKNKCEGWGRERATVITPVMPLLSPLLRGQTARRMSSEGRVWSEQPQAEVALTLSSLGIALACPSS